MLRPKNFKQKLHQQVVQAEALRMEAEVMQKLPLHFPGINLLPNRFTEQHQFIQPAEFLTLIQAAMHLLRRIKDFFAVPLNLRRGLLTDRGLQFENHCTSQTNRDWPATSYMQNYFQLYIWKYFGALK